MAHNVEPMDIDNIEGDFDNKENTYHHSNVLPRTPCTEKGYEELDVSELNMKLRYSITPASSPMSKSYTAHCLDNRNLECPENVNSVDNPNLTHSFNSTLTKSDVLSKSLKLQPLKLHSTDTSLDNNRNTSVLRQLETIVTEDGTNVSVTVTEVNDMDENLSLPSSSSSALHTPEATTPTKEIPKHDGGSPIMRGLKSVLNMFRASQSPIPTVESEDHAATHDISSPVEVAANKPLDMSQVHLASTPITARKQREASSKRGSPLKESIVFNEDLEKELLWKDETTILFSEEKIPIHKLFFQQSKNVPPIGKEFEVSSKAPVFEDSLNETVEFMDVSYNDSVVKNKTISEITDAPPNGNVAESDSEFVDCETTFTQQLDDEHAVHDVEKTSTPVINSDNILNKTAQELQLTATEEGDKKSLNIIFAESNPEVVTQEAPKLVENNNQEHVNYSVAIESKDTMSQDTTREIETRVNNENFLEPLDGTISIQSGDKQMTSSTLMNITHDFKTQMTYDLTPVFDETVNKDSLSSSAMNNAIQSIEVTSSIDETKPANSTVSIESIDKPIAVSSFIMNTTQNVPPFATEQLGTTTEIEMPVSATNSIANATHNIESPLAVDNIIEPQNITETIEDKPVLLSTFIMNSAQNNETPLVFENKNEQLNVTKKSTNESVSSSIWILNDNQNPGTRSAVGNINEQLNATRNIQENPVLSSTFIMNATDNAEEHSNSEKVNELLNTTFMRSEITKPLDATVTVALGDTPVSSSTFTMDTIKHMDPHLATSENNELPDATVIVDSKDMLASSTFIKDVSQGIKSHIPGENITPLDSTIFVDTQNKQVSSSTFTSNDKRDITQKVEKKSLDITMEPISSSTFINDMNQCIVSQAGDIVSVPYLNTNAAVEVPRQTELPKDTEHIDTSEALDVTLSTDKSMTSFADFKDVTHQIIDPEVLKNCINALDVTLNTDLNNQSEEITAVTENASFSDDFKQTEFLMKTEVPTTSKDTTILGQGNTELEISHQIRHDIEKDLVNAELTLDSAQPVNLFQEQADKQTISDQFIPNEIVEIVNVDSLNSSGDVAKIPINMSEGQVLNMNDVNRKIEIHTEKGCGENVPANIPLPDEDDLEIESLKAVQHCVINNVAFSNVLPDVVNNMDTSKIQDANRIDEEPINTIEHIKAPADLITDTLTYNEIILDNSEMNKESNAMNEENYKLIDTTKAYLVNNYKEISSENPMELPPALVKYDNEQRKVGESVTKSEQHVESMDISYNAHDIFIQKDSEIPSSDITTAVRNEIKSFGQDIAKTNEEKTDISLQSETICPKEKIDAVANIMTAAKPDVNNLKHMSVDDMELGMVVDKSVIAEKKETVQFQKSFPNTQSGTIPIKDSIHEEIIVSENNSPYVLVSVDKETNKKLDSSLEEDFENIENPFASRTKISPSPPASPPIASKGYNFDFDNLDDPFATKTKIRASPPLDSPKQTARSEKPEFKKEISKREPIKNKRKSFPVRPKPVTNKKNFNSTYDGLPMENDSAKEKPDSANYDSKGVKGIPNLNKTQTPIVEDAKFSYTNIEESELNAVAKSEFENNRGNMTEVVNVKTRNEATRIENKSPLTSTTPSSSDQSVYLSAATSSGDSITARNVFNLPEIDDMNFNPFATKSKILQSPPLNLEANISRSKSDTDTTVMLHENSENDYVDKPFASRTKISPSPPASPPIASKGYNFDFDNLDDPFATKTKIRVSPPLDSPKQTARSEKPEYKKEISKREPIKNKRKSFPVRPKPVTNKKNFNSTYDGSPMENDSAKEKPDSANYDSKGVKDIPNLNKTQTPIVEDAKFSYTNIEESELNAVAKSEFENNRGNMTEVVNVKTRNEATRIENKSPLTSTTPSSSDQSVYLSAATSSGDSITARNVFNLPEIDDMNFNPFATKSKMLQSPPLCLEANISRSKSDTDTTVMLHENSENDNVDKPPNLSQNRLGQDEKDLSNFSNTTCSSKGDKNTTVREVHTDSDDTIEGPFLEADDNEAVGLGLANNVKDDEFTDLGHQNDMMQFSDLPCQDNEDNEMFIDAAAYEFLINQNKSNVVVDSGKESLFLKFDPLFAKRLSSEGIAATLSKIQKRQSTPKKMVKPPQIANVEQSVSGPSTSKVPPQQSNTAEDIFEDLNVTTSKPMMVVTPAVNPIVMQRKPTTPTSSNRRSITFTSPAIAVIDRLLSMSANNSLADENTTITQVSREQNEADMALVQLRELLAEKEINVYNLRSESKELRDRLTTLESQMQALEVESEQRLKKVNELTEKLSEKTKINKSMAAVVEEYERTIASLIAETEQDRKRHAEEREKLIKERDEETAHLASMEVSFSDLHSKYEKSKQIIFSCKANEDKYKKSFNDFEENLTKMQNNYELLKQHATSKLNHANQELEKMNRAHESEVLKLNAMIKRKELHITSLEETLAQKTKANEELTAICDELINKVG